MFRFSNALLGCLNLLTFIFSISILSTGVWLAKQGATECDKWLDKPLIVLGVFLVGVSLLGVAGAWCRNSFLLWIYLAVMFLLIVLVFIFIIFAFAVTSTGSGVVLPGKAYKEYRLGDYSRWLQNRVIDQRNWNRIKSCLQSGELCSDYGSKYVNDDFQKFYAEKLSPLQSGCCKPPSECKFVYQSPTVWNKTGTGNYSSPDCGSWDNDPKVLCFNCNSCKAGLLQNVKMNWKKSAVINIIFLVLMIIVYAIGICAFRNNKRDEWQGSS
ncbi:tetraspanin-8-like [Neltuma alba]|uniref:tetraspanin-8-like n=1 Tax=Neltuma alba TaxID=207710 RepID=UPI0010A44D2C|nr:tetraspanin-8-like [Prosopis alba]